MQAQEQRRRQIALQMWTANIRDELRGAGRYASPKTVQKELRESMRKAFAMADIWLEVEAEMEEPE